MPTIRDKNPKTTKKSSVGQAIGALFGQKGRLTKKQFQSLQAMKIPGLRGSKLKKKKNGPS